MGAVVGVLVVVLWTFLIFLFARLVFDYVQMFARSWRPHGIVLIVAEAVYTVTDPPLRALRRVIPPLRLGSVSLDLSFFVLFIAVYLGLQVLYQFTS